MSDGKGAARKTHGVCCLMASWKRPQNLGLSKAKGCASFHSFFFFFFLTVESSAVVVMDAGMVCEQ